MPLTNPVIVVPGATATYLRDQYSIPPEIIWAVIQKNYERAALHPDDLKKKVSKARRALESKEPARIVPDQLYEISYKELVEELRYNLREKEDQKVPVFSFGYDWRQPLEVIEEELSEFIDEVIDRTCLMRNYHQARFHEDPQVNLVGHSMGGLIIAGYLARFGQTKKVNKVVSLASPFQGSFEVAPKVTTGTANLGENPPSSREREAARITPAIYYLVPSFSRGLDVDPGIPADFFDPALWQRSIIETIAEYIRLHGLNRMTVTSRREMASQIFEAMLKAARAHRRRLDNLKLDSAGLAQEDWLCIIGVDATTRIALKVKKRGEAAEFEFRPGDRDNFWSEAGVADETRRMTGDGTVPFEGAIPQFLPYQSLVCLTPGDFGYWEIADQATLRVAGFHGIFPNMNLVHRLIVRHFTGRPDRHANTWGRPPPGVAATNWTPPISLKLPKS
jgi:pimeloyl-ACP methyl ester carboxylesterase